VLQLQERADRRVTPVVDSQTGGKSDFGNRERQIRRLTLFQQRMNGLGPRVIQYREAFTNGDRPVKGAPGGVLLVFGELNIKGRGA
jgi:hypothetical protein